MNRNINHIIDARVHIVQEASRRVRSEYDMMTEVKLEVLLVPRMVLHASQVCCQLKSHSPLDVHTPCQAQAQSGEVESHLLLSGVVDYVATPDHPASARCMNGVPRVLLSLCWGSIPSHAVNALVPPLLLSRLKADFLPYFRMLF
jgi:hypothetical protein